MHRLPKITVGALVAAIAIASCSRDRSPTTDELVDEKISEFIEHDISDDATVFIRALADAKTASTRMPPTLEIFIDDAAKIVGPHQKDGELVLPKEFRVVSDSFAEQIEEIDEIVEPLGGLQIWARTTVGPIEKDPSIRTVAEGIIEGIIDINHTHRLP